MEKIRLDKLMVNRGIVPSRARAVRLIESGGVVIGDETVTDPSSLFSHDVNISLTEEDIPWVSRAGLKLEHALKTWHIEVKGKTCLDVGASTGGFTQVLLSYGAKQVFSVDVGTNQLAPILRNDPRVLSLEQTHILELPHKKIPRVSLVVVDLSFISLLKVMEHIAGFLLPQGEMIVLIKPQFEVGKELIAKGIVRDEHLRVEARDRVLGELKRIGFTIKGVTESPILGGDGNVEFLAYATKPV